MKLINRSVRKLSQQIDDPEKKQENLQLLGEIERAAVTAKSMPVPAKRAPRGGPEGAPRGRVEEHNEAPMPAAQNEKQPQGAPPAADPQREETFRRDLMKLIRQALDIEQDLMDGKPDQAKADLKKIAEIRNDAHKELGVRQGRD
jgi:soluble cytochrome b562